MGLNLEINARLVDKKTKVETVIEIAYWRKAYAIRDMLVDVAERYKAAHPENLDDISITCYLFALDNIINNLIGELQNLESPYWTDSIWEPTITRQQTIKQIDHLLFFKDWLLGKVDTEAMLFNIEHFMDDMESFGERKDYNVYLEIVNSY